MARAHAAARVAMKVLVEEHEVPPVRIVRVARSSPWQGRRPSSSGRKKRVRRVANSRATSLSVIMCPDPVGHSTRNESP